MEVGAYLQGRVPNFKYASQVMLYVRRSQSGVNLFLLVQSELLRSRLIQALSANENFMTEIQTLTRYKAWADDLFLAVVSRIPNSELVAPRPIIFGSLIRTLNHSLAMDYVWKCHLLGKSHGLTTRNPEECPEIHQLVEIQQKLDQWYVDYADSISEDRLKELVYFEFIGGGTGRMTRLDILLHVVNHTTYHRGHAAGILYYLNIFPPTTDLPIFLKKTMAGSRGTSDLFPH